MYYALPKASGIYAMTRHSKKVYIKVTGVWNGQNIKKTGVMV